MLSSITPLGQRGRGMSWGRTVFSFWIGATVAATGLFTIAGVVGGLAGFDQVDPWVYLVVVVAAAALDLRGVRPPGPHRQVDEGWLGRYRDWVVGLGFGGQLGLGFMTIVPSWGYWAVLVVAAAMGLPWAALIGVGFGVGRSLLLLAARRVGSPNALADMMRRFTGAESAARRLTVAGYAIVLLTVVVNVV